MNNNRKNMNLPKKCYAVLPYEDRLVIITKGKPGYERSPLDRSDKHQNRVIADEKNTEFGGVTLEQEKSMIKGAIFGWKSVSLSGQESEPAEAVFELEISRPGSLGADTSSTLSLPATPYEIMDALDKARVTDNRVIYSIEITDCKLDYLPQLIPQGANLYELNNLSAQLARMSEWELDCFTGLKNNYSSSLQIFLSARNGRQDSAPKIPITRNSRAAPEPFPAPSSAIHRLSVGCTAMNGSNTLSTKIPPHKYPKGIVKNCKVFLTE